LEEERTGRGGAVEAGGKKLPGRYNSIETAEIRNKRKVL